MTPTDVSDLLRYCASIDGFLKQTSPEEGAVMVAGWITLLEPVPADVAMRAARAHYSHQGHRTITPADILAAWAGERAAEQHAEDREQRQPLTLPSGAPQVQTGIDVGHPADYLAAMVAVVREGGDPASVPRPAGVAVLTPHADEMSRRCVYHALCACTHTECRDGWLDVEGTVVNGLGRRYPAAQRCMICKDALLMAEERGIAKKPSKASYGPRR